MRIFFVVFASVLSLAVAQDYLCDGLDESTRLPSDDSCAEFLECIGGSPVRRECPAGQYFDINTSECAPSDTVECAADTTTNAPPTPPGPQINCSGVENNAYVPSPISCSDYYQCVDGRAFLLSCPRGLYFIRDSRVCTYPSEANCDLTQPTSTPPTIRPPPTISCDGVPNFRFVASRMSCANYYQCVDGNAFLLSCPRGLYFSEQKQTCTNPSEANCDLTEPTPPPPIPPPSCDNVDNFRFIRHPSSCSDYFQCLNGTAVLLSCPRGLYFDERIQTCVYPGNVQCIINPPGSPPTTLPPPIDVSCSGVDDFAFISHPISCAMYYQCMNGQPILALCPVGRYFDEQVQSCLDSDAVNCGARTRRPTTTSLPPVVDQQCQGVAEGRLVSNVNSCSTFYECLDGRAWPRFCDDNLWFDEELQDCDLPERTNCAVGSTTQSTDNDEICEGEDNGVYVGSRTHCEIFYFCVNGQAYEGRCQENHWFDRQLRECLPQDEVDCRLETIPTTTDVTSTTDSSIIGLCREARNGTYIRNSMACGEFFVCIDDEPHGRICPEGLWFNFNQQRCTEPYEAWCELDSIVCLGIEEGLTVRAPSSCSDFLTCENGIPFPGRCYNNMFFNEETGYCESPEDFECDLETPVEPPRGPCDGAPDFRLRGSWDDCSVYYVCYANEIIFDLTCPEDQTFDQETEVCGEDFECLLE